MTTILVIEDDDIVRKLIRKILTQRQYEVLEAAGGQGGVQLALAAQPDLILCDVMMPGMDGYGVLQQLQEHPETAMIPFVFLTARAEKQDIRQGMRLGADDYLTKPFTKEELLAAIAMRLNKLSSLQQHYKNSDVMTKAIAPGTVSDSAKGCGDRFSLQETFETVVQTLALDQPGQLPLLVIGFEQYAEIAAALTEAEMEQLKQAVIGRFRESLQGQGHIFCLTPGSLCFLGDRPQTQATIEAIAQQIVDAFSHGLTLSTAEYLLSARIGIAQYPQDAAHLPELVAQAEAAQREVQNREDQHYQFAHRLTPPQGYPSAIDLASDLRDALQRQQLMLHYQPQFHLATGQVLGAEALLRWEHPLRGLLPTVEVLAIAQANGLLTRLDQFVLTQACRQLRRWGLADNHHFQLAINLSQAQFNQLNFHQDLSRLLIENALNPISLVLELTEATLLENITATIRRLKAIKTLGVKIALDDFGLGYSSLNYLQKFPFDFLKLDLSLIQNLQQHPSQQTLVSALIQTAHAQQRQVIAEGVEHQGELACLRQLNCDRIQGFLCGYPVSATEFEQQFLSLSL
ncbi:REC domain-containing phosphodiesterase [Synechococcus moorigangaii CMS01]|nr:REC domain-containing phosphodiesterase [Synechococcus moorigangaii CMS01]